MTGRLIRIARAPERMAPLEELDQVTVTVKAGITGDARGQEPGRQVTVLFREGWQDACREAGRDLHWTARRANLYVEGLECPREIGGLLRIGNVLLRGTDETKPCALMEQTLAGLRAAMRPEWRGGVCCDVICGGEICLGDAVTLEQLSIVAELGLGKANSVS